MNKPLTVLGLMSGSSLDGLDLAICTFEGDRPENISSSTVAVISIPLHRELVDRLRNAAKLSARNLHQLEIDFSTFCAREINEFILGLTIQIDFIACHGHTVFHYPEDGYTCQLISGAIISERTNIPCITDFRSNDIALGGQGAPLAPIVEQYLYPGFNYYFNLGGIANLSVHKPGNILSMDSCPCNQVLNHVMNELGQPFDDKGQLAQKGKVSEKLLDQWVALEYFDRPYPKSMDNTWVREVFIPVMDHTTLSPQDKLASSVAFISRQLLKDVHLLSAESKLATTGMITGGGAFNDFLVARIKEHLSTTDLNIVRPDNDTINYKEAILMALMGYLRVKRIPNTIPSVTGARRPTVGGALYIP